MGSPFGATHTGACERAPGAEAPERAGRDPGESSLRRVSAAVAQSLLETGWEVMLALTDIDPESGQIGIHIQRLPARGTSHSWTLWTGSDDGPMAEAVSRTEQDVEAYESAGGGLPTNPTASSSSTSFPKAKAAPVPTRRPNIPKAVAKPSRHSMNANNARKWGLIFVCLCQP